MTEKENTSTRHEDENQNKMAKIELESARMKRKASRAMRDTSTMTDAVDTQSRMHQLESENKQLSNKIAELTAKHDTQLKYQIDETIRERNENQRLQDLVDTLRQQLYDLQVQVVPSTPLAVRTEETDPMHRDRVVPDVTRSLPFTFSQPTQETSPNASLNLDDFHLMEEAEKKDDFYYKRQLLPPQVVEKGHKWQTVTAQIRNHKKNLLRPVIRHPTDGVLVRRTLDGLKEKLPMEMRYGKQQCQEDGGDAVVPSTP